MKDKRDAQNKPSYCNLTDQQWQETSESTRQTILNSLNDEVSVKAYYRFHQTLKGYMKVRKGLKKIADFFDGNLPDFFWDLKDSIDPLSRVIWEDVDNRIQSLKDDRREILRRLLSKSAVHTNASEIREDILDEIERLDQS